MVDRLAGKHCLITGGNRGIGEAIVRFFIAEGARAVFTGRDTKDSVARGNAISAELGTTFRTLEITDEDGWQKIIDEFAHDPFNVLVNNAGGINYPKPLLDLTSKEWRWDIEVNLTGPFLGMRAVLPSMLERGSGSIINISSMSGIRAQRDGAAYQAAKSGLRWLTKNAAMTYATRGIRVNTINPGVIVTPHQQTMPDEREQWFFDRIPMQRRGIPDEVATAVVFLASDESSYVTGAELEVDGGYAI